MKSNVINKPRLNNETTLPSLQVPYDVEFDFKGKHYAMRLINNLSLEQTLIDKRNELMDRNKTPRGRVFTLEINENGASVSVYTFSEKAFDYYHSNWVRRELCNYQGTVENLKFKPAAEELRRFELQHIWDADGQSFHRLNNSTIWEKAKAIFHDNVALGVVNVDQIAKIVENLSTQTLDKLKELGATETELAFAPDYSKALVQYVGSTPISIKNIKESTSPILFSEGNPTIGFNVVIDLASLDLIDKALFTDELCGLLNYVGPEYVLEDVVKKAIEPNKIGKVSLYVGPNESLAKAYKRTAIDWALNYHWNEWAKEQKHHEQIKAYALQEVNKAKAEYEIENSLAILNDVLHDEMDKELIKKIGELKKASENNEENLKLPSNSQTHKPR